MRAGKNGPKRVQESLGADLTHTPLVFCADPGVPMPRQIDQIFLVRVAGCGAIAVSLRPAEANLPGGSDIDIAAGRASRLTKNYAVGLEMSCPGGAYHWALKSPALGG